MNNSIIAQRLLSSNINCDDKVKAINDIIMMETNKEYREQTCFDYNEEILFKSFIFNKSILGFEFWIKISDQIDSN
jgi:hypothetical protein